MGAHSGGTTGRGVIAAYGPYATHGVDAATSPRIGGEERAASPWGWGPGVAVGVIWRAYLAIRQVGVGVPGWSGSREPLALTRGQQVHNETNGEDQEVMPLFLHPNGPPASAWVDMILHSYFWTSRHATPGPLTLTFFF